MKQIITFILFSLMLSQDYSLALDGIDDYVSINSITNEFTTGSDMSVSLWFKVAAENLTTSMIGNIIISAHYDCQSDGCAQINNNKFRLGIDGQDGTGGIYLSTTGDDGMHSGDTASGSGYHDNQWHHLALNIDNEGYKRVWIDGEEIDNSPYNSQPIGWDTANLFSIGQEWDEDSNTDFFPGKIDELQIWDRLVNPTEMIQSQFSPSYSDDLLGYWKFNNNLQDQSENEYHGINHGDASYSDDVMEYIYGCTDEEANNYDLGADIDDGSCTYDGCTNVYADNYNPQANVDDGSCEYSIVPVYGTAYLEEETDHSNITINFTPSSGSAQPATASTDENGNFFALVSPGIYAVTFSKDGYIEQTLSGEYNLFTPTTLEPMTLNEGEILEISGTIDGSQQWSDWYEYHVTGDLFLSSGDTLIIDPGVNVVFDGYYNFIVEGVLNANGTEQDSIKFTSGQINKSFGDWQQFRFQDSGADGSYLNYCVVEYGGGLDLHPDSGYNPSTGKSSIEILSTSVTISNSTVNHSGATGIWTYSANDNSIISNTNIYNSRANGMEFYGTEDLTVQNCHIDNSGFSGTLLYAIGGNLNIIGNTISNNNYHGLNFRYETANLNIINNTFILNNNHGIAFSLTRYDYSVINIEGNEIILLADNGGNDAGIYMNNVDGDVSISINNNTFSQYQEGYEGVGVHLNNTELDEFSGNTLNRMYYGTFLDHQSIIYDFTNNTIHDANQGIRMYNATSMINNFSSNVFTNILEQNIYNAGIINSIKFNALDESADFGGDGSYPNLLGEINQSNINGHPSDTWYNIFIDDPMFTDTESGDFTPLPGSPLIDAGDIDEMDPDGTISDIGSHYYDQGSIAPEIQSISSTQLYGARPLYVQLSAVFDGPVTSWNWDAGNGQSSTNYSPIISYNEAGVYTVSLTVEGPGGSDTFQHIDFITVVEPALPPSANFTSNLTTGLAPLDVEFTNLTLNQADSYMWDFGDGGTSSNASPSHTYETPGDYTVSLTAEGPYGQDTHIIENYITALGPEAIVASFNIDETVGVAPFTINFENTTIGTVDSYLWNFGDENTSTEENPVYTYDEYGTYTVTLTATGPINEDSLSQNIDVFLPSPIITDISDIPDDQGGRVYLTFVRSGHDTDSLNRFESYQIERYDDVGWVGVTNYNAYGTDVYNIEVPTLVDSTQHDTAVTSFRVIASMDEGLFASNQADGYSVDNLPPAPPENLFASVIDNEITIRWDYIYDDDFGYHQLNNLWNAPEFTTSNSLATDINTEYNEYDVNSVDIHGNYSNISNEKVAGYQISSGANLLSFSVLPENQDISNIIDIADITSVVGEGTAANYNDFLGWVGSLTEIDVCKGYWLLSNDENILVTVGDKQFCEMYNIHYGANLISYTCSYETSINSIANLLIENDINTVIGQGEASTYTQIGWVGSLQNLSPGSGYWLISESDDVELSLECTDQPEETTSRESIVQVDGYTQSTQQAFYFFEDIEGVEVGDVIRAYHGDNLIGGRTWTGPYTDVPAMGVDSQDATQGYAAQGSMIRFTIQKNNENEMNLSGSFPSWLENGVFIIESANIEVEIPSDYSLGSVYPNPFNPSTTINYSVPEMSWVNIAVYDITGVEVSRLVDGYVNSGYHTITWNAKEHASGVYIVKIKSSGFSDSQKVMLMK